MSREINSVVTKPISNSIIPSLDGGVGGLARCDMACGRGSGDYGVDHEARRLTRKPPTWPSGNVATTCAKRIPVDLQRAYAALRS